MLFTPHLICWCLASLFSVVYKTELVSGIFTLNLSLGKERELAVMTKVPSEPKGEKIYQPES